MRLLTAMALLATACPAALAQPSPADAMLRAAATTQAREAYDEIAAHFEKSVAQRESQRAEKIAEAWASLDEHLAKAETARDAGETNRHAAEVSEAVRLLVELDVLKGKPQRDGLKADPRFAAAVDQAVAAARDAEARGEWVLAGELFGRLNALFEDERTYEEDADRLLHRMGMVRLYAPRRLWDLTNERRLLAGEKPFPAYNPFGDSFEEKLEPVRDQMVLRALQNAAYRHIEPGDPRTMLLGGLEAVETFATTEDLEAVFPGLASDRNRAAFLGQVGQIRERITAKTTPLSIADLSYTVSGLLRANRDTVRVMDQALLHEFANGALDELDKYTAIIWPDEIKRFERSTQGRFTGVGIQIEMDDFFNIKVVTPLPGTPAQKAGISAGDIITHVGGRSIEGFTLDQAVEVITGPEFTDVSITVARPDAADPENGPRTNHDYSLTRRAIDLPTVKGWRKTGPADDAWDWFVDKDAGIGYIRITSFSENTTAAFDAAVESMRRDGLNGLVLDLRFNPGGLLDQAVSISNRFVDDGLIVKTEGASGVVRERKFAEPVPAGRSLTDIPVAVLINEGSASASEIVSGAIQAYAREGRVRAWVVGENSFGKGSVQNVFSIDPAGEAMMKLTTHYYKLRDDRMIHRLPDAAQWGVPADIEVEMLPEQIVEAITIRRDADVFEIDQQGNAVQNAERPDPDKLIDDGVDLQLIRAIAQVQEARAASLAAADRR